MRLICLATALVLSASPANSSPPATELRVQAGGAILAGTLTLPEGRPRAAIVLIQGAGPHGRDQVISGAPMFKEIAEGLARAGVASVRVDNSGVGKSTGSKVAHFRERVPQFGEVLKEMRRRRELAGVPMGVLGHSEGSLVATELWQSNDEAIDFMVLVGAPGQPGRKVWVDQQSNPERFSGKDAKTLAEIRSTFEQIADASIAGDQPALGAAADRLFIITGLIPEQVREIRPDFIRRMASEEMRVFLAHDPAKSFALVKDPILAVWGTHDKLTEPSSNAPIFLSNRNPASALTLLVLPNEDHFFLRGEGLLPGKHKSGRMRLSDRLIAEIIRFVDQATKAI